MKKNSYNTINIMANKLKKQSLFDKLKEEEEKLNDDFQEDSYDEDYLDVDKPLPNQNWVCMSFVSPEKVLKTKEDYYFYTSKLSWSRGEFAIIAYHKKHNDCFISSSILTEITGFFSLDLNTSMNVIKDWVENKLGVDIDYPYSDVGAD